MNQYLTGGINQDSFIPTSTVISEIGYSLPANEGNLMLIKKFKKKFKKIKIR